MTDIFKLDTTLNSHREPYRGKCTIEDLTLRREMILASQDALKSSPDFYRYKPSSYETERLQELVDSLKSYQLDNDMFFNGPDDIGKPGLIGDQIDKGNWVCEVYDCDGDMISTIRGLTLDMVKEIRRDSEENGESVVAYKNER